VCPNAIEGKYSLNVKPKESFSVIQKALTEMQLKDFKIKKSIPFSYILVEYKAGWLDKRQIEFLLEDKQSYTQVSIKWFYPSAEFLQSWGVKKEMRAWEEEEKYKTERLFEELKSRIGATEIQPSILKEKELIKEKEVIVKIRCPYCHNLYDETLDKCPHCGAKR
jgi:hypothetical protein